jgi:AraC-like DNA-binding protein
LPKSGHTHELGERSRAQVAKAQNKHFVVVLLRSGRLKITQAGRECVLSPNMFTLFDCNGPYTFHHVEPTEVLDVIVPAGAMRARLKEPEAYVAQPRSAGSGLGRVMADMFQSLAREAPLIPEGAADDCARRVADMMGIVFDSAGDGGLPIGESAVRSAIYRRCAAFIENNLDDPGLDPAMIAAAGGISVRYLHKIFHGSGESVGDHVRRLRLARSYDDLIDLRKRHVKIKEIAFRCGFKNPTHFSDAFKDFHGISPSAVRRAASVNKLS